MKDVFLFHIKVWGHFHVNVAANLPHLWNWIPSEAEEEITLN